MPCTMFSRVAVLVALAASALAAPEPTTTAALQSFLSISNLDASQAADISTRFDADKARYYATITTDPAYISALGAAATVMPASARRVAGINPELFLASLAQASPDDLPDWFTALPSDVQDVWKSMGSEDIEMYTSEVHIVRPLSAEVASSLSSAVKSITSSATSVITSRDAKASSIRSSEQAKASSMLASASASAQQKAGAPASPLSSGKMGIVAGGVAVAAGLVGMALL
ncbi:MAG: hypothetical protein L6R36_003122 [Xanthoria steineri]|nr:MAG: hypothetical protein L6R36_003122 [Xanthoria steineri]